MVKNKKTIQFIGVDCILMVILTLLDQWTKSLVVHHLKDQSDIILIPGVFQLYSGFYIVVRKTDVIHCCIL